MRLRGRGLAITAVAAASALTLAACGSDSDSDAAGSESDGASGGTFSVGLQTPQDLTPSNCYDLYCANILQGVTTGLYTFETEGTSMQTVGTPLLNSVSTEDDGKTYTIEINPGSTFTNGEEVTAQTFVDTWNFAANGGNGQQLGFVFGPSQLNVEGYEDVKGEKSTDGEMSGLQATSDTTIEVSLVEPIGQTLFENYVAGPQVLPMPSVAFEDVDAFNKQPIGNGPYMMEGPWETTGATLVRNPGYAYEAGKADQIEFKFYPDENALWADLQADNLDVSTYLPITALATAESVLGDRFINESALAFSYEAFPTQVKAFENRDVRVALSKAVDWDEINEKLYYNTRTKATAFGPPSVAGGGTDACGDGCVFDAEAAKQLLDDAGGIPGNKVELSGLANSENQLAKAECNMIQKNLGVECTVKLFESFGEMLDAFDELGPNDEGFILALGWVADNPTLSNMIAPLFGTDAGSNDIDYSNDTFDTLIAEGNQAADEETAVAKWQEAEKVLYEDFAGHATQWRNNVGGYSANVSNVQVNPGGFYNIADITVNSAG